MRFFLPNMERMYPLSYLQHMSVHRAMDWDLSRFVSGVSLGRLGAKEIHSTGYGKEVFGLFSGLVRSEYPRGETPKLGTTFINQFMKVRGVFPSTFVRSGGFILPTDPGRVGWLDLCLLSLELCCSNWDYITRSGLYSD